MPPMVKITYASAATNIFAGTYHDLEIKAASPTFCGNIIVTGTITTPTITGSTCGSTVTINSGTVTFGGVNPVVWAGTYDNLTIESGSATLCGDVTVNGALTITSSASLEIGANNLTVNGTTSISGTLSDGDINGTQHLQRYNYY